MYKKMLIVLGAILCVFCFFSVNQYALATGHVESIRFDVEKDFVSDSLRTVAVQDTAKTGLILLAKNCADVCGPSPTKECDKWGKNHCCECCEPLPKHCDKPHKIKKVMDKIKDKADEIKDKAKDVKNDHQGESTKS